MCSSSPRRSPPPCCVCLVAPPPPPQGTFSEVLKAQSLSTGEHYAIKCMKSSFKNLDQVNSLREIQALRRLNPHPNIIDLEEVLYDKSSGRLALVFELMDQNIYELIRGRKQPLKTATVKLLMFQLFKAVAHMHKHGIFHRGTAERSRRGAGAGAERSISWQQPIRGVGK